MEGVSRDGLNEQQLNNDLSTHYDNRINQAALFLNTNAEATAAIIFAVLGVGLFAYGE
jgi:hypothetical protein